MTFRICLFPKVINFHLKSELMKILIKFIFIDEKDEVCYYQPDMSGHLNPRSLVAAQQKIAKDNSCELINAVVSSISGVDEGFKIETKSAQVFTTSKIVLANGAYANFLPNIKV